ncbi:MAG: uncharacterized protein KVP18_004310 [Porospora cf. gigantea A]|uniref:uncharacterized protein n=1 Tax=Porospora cf. gigantea A TaxID=2853593 RepID=UPI003559764A|nr:MAG: hypothetical protein KVP18_004310 [Porospora cf. gigantea A]
MVQRLRFLLIHLVASSDWHESLNGYCARLFSEYENPQTLSPDMEKSFRSSRRIPPLESEMSGLKLIHVQSVIRHGARALSEEHIERFNMEETIQWDCSFNESFMPEEIQQPPFYKIYDASPQHNLLKGTCANGQLLAEGAYQTRILGDIVREAYFSDNNVFRDKSKSLVDPTTADTSDAFSKLFYVRSTDKPRTKLSGSNYMSSILKDFTMMGDALPIHTMDAKHETLDPNWVGYCPEIDHAYNLSESSPQKQSLERENDVVRNEVYDAFNANLDGIWPWGVMDMLKCHICADKVDQLPESVRATDEWRQELMVRALKAVDAEDMFRFHFNNAAYSKSAMIRPMVEMKSWFLSAYAEYASKTAAHNSTLDSLAIEFQERIDDLKRLNRDNLPKFVLFSAHDYTIMPLLASLGAWENEAGEFVFPPYASMINYEYYESKGLYYFRLVYNGEVITSRISGCEEQAVCDVRTLFTASDFANPASYATTCLPVEPDDGASLGILVLVALFGVVLLI